MTDLDRRHFLGLGAAATAAGPDVLATVKAIIAEQTGYTTDMLEDELDLEADLGIDTVKQAEVFAAIREVYDIPRRDDLKLRDYNTLTKVVAFVHESRPDLASPSASAEAGAAPDPAAPAAWPVRWESGWRIAAAPAGRPRTRRVPRR